MSDAIDSGLRALRTAFDRLDDSARRIADASIGLESERPQEDAALAAEASDDQDTAEDPLQSEALRNERLRTRYVGIEFLDFSREVVEQRMALLQGRAALRAMSASLEQSRSVLDIKV